MTDEPRDVSLADELKLGESERLCLAALAEYYGPDQNCLCFKSIAAVTQLNLAQVKRAVRRLARKGLAEFHRGLFDDDGRVAGAGYCCTRAGARVGASLAESFEETE